MRMKIILMISVLIFSAVIFVMPALSLENQDSERMTVSEEIDEELRYLKAETYVITASRVMEEINKAPASITVITDRQIRQMGAKHLNNVLNRMVPSFWSPRYFLGGMYIPVFRGGARILTMINSHSIVPTSGLVFFGYDTLNVDNIKRIEVIRGPGSALYGANAYDGIINIITKGAEDIDGVELTARGGSWDTQQYNMLFGKTFSDLEVAFNFNYFKTHGHRAFIEEDQQTQFDQILQSYGIPSDASLAPGRTKGDDEKYDVALNLKLKGFTFDGRYVDRELDYPFSNPRPVLTEKANHVHEEYYLNLSYQRALSDGIDLSGRVYRNYHEYILDVQMFPPGFITRIPNPTPPPDTIFYSWPEGFLYKHSKKDSRSGIEIQADYKISDSNTMVAGATYEIQRAYDYKHWNNWLNTDLPNVFIPLPSQQRTPDDLTDYERNFKAVFLEYISDVTENIRVTTGLRYDHYSDFGGHLSPRIGLTWEYLKGYDVKLLYGHAYLTPSDFQNRFRASTSKLDPQTVETYEISLGADFTSFFSSRITFYQKDEKDLIEATLIVEPFNYVNRGSEHWQGVEVEVKYDFGRGTYIAGNYNYSNTGLYRFSPRHFAKLMSNIRLSRYFNFYTDCVYIGGMSRMPGDLRDDTSSFIYVNTTLIARKFLKAYEGLELRGSVYNLFDEDWSQWIDENVPYGWPQPGRNYLIELKYSF